MRVGEKVLLLTSIGVAGAVVWTKGFQGTPFDSLFDESARKHGVDGNLLRAIGFVESAFNPDAISAINPNGTRDYGLMQINERTAQSLGVGRSRLLDPAVSIDTAARLLVLLKRELLPILSLQTLIAAYNAGSPAILSRGIINPDYVGKVLSAHLRFVVGALFR